MVSPATYTGRGPALRPELVGGQDGARHGLLNLSGGVGIVASSPCYDQQLDPLGVFQLPTKASFSPYMLDFCGWEMVYLLASAAGYFALAVLLDVGLSFPAVRARFDGCSGLESVADAPSEADGDVAAEAARVASGASARARDVVVLDGLRKVHGPRFPLIHLYTIGVGPR